MKVILAVVLLMSGSLIAQKPAPAPVVSETLAAQVMLDRAGFSSGEIDGRTGVNVKNALHAFQRAAGLAPSDTMNDATWQKLHARTGDAPPLVSYAVTDSDVAGPFTAAIPRDLVEQAALPALGYESALELIAEKFHASPQLLRTLNPGASFQHAGDQLMVPNIDQLPGESAPARRPAGDAESASSGRITIFVTKSTSALTVEDESGTVIFHAPVTSGSEHDPLPIGRWKVTGIQRNPTFHYNPELFWDATPGHSKATLQPGPNNPVGLIWIDLSKPHYGIHGTPEPSHIGHVQSHGCVRLTNWDLQRLARWARPGTPVVFRE